MQSTDPFRHDFWPALHSRDSGLPWIPSATPGKSAKPLRFLPGNSGFVELLRMEPGVVMPLHRHTGAIHAFNLQGTRRLCTGEIVGPGDYVYEPPGNTDWWEVVGNEALVAWVVVMGEVQFLAEDRSVLTVVDAARQWEDYRRHCEVNGIPVQDLR